MRLEIERLLTFANTNNNKSIWSFCSMNQPHSPRSIITEAGKKTRAVIQEGKLLLVTYACAVTAVPLSTTRSQLSIWKVGEKPFQSYMSFQQVYAFIRSDWCGQ